ncbi:MAG: hypothetical protein ACK5UP_06615, partial [Bacteroidota bacterium]
LFLVFCLSSLENYALVFIAQANRICAASKPRTTKRIFFNIISKDLSIGETSGRPGCATQSGEKVTQNGVTIISSTKLKLIYYFHVCRINLSRI